MQNPAITRAMSLAIDRRTLVEKGYGNFAEVSCNIINAPQIYQSSNNNWCKTQDIDQANSILDDAGWMRGADGVRSKDGVRLQVSFQTSTNAIRQDTQLMIKGWWSQIGIETSLRRIDPGTFFSGDPNLSDTTTKFYADIQMYTVGIGINPESYLRGKRCEKIPSPQNNWEGGNVGRFCDSNYDALVETLAITAPMDERVSLIVQMNDILVNRGSVIPLFRRSSVSAHSLSLKGVPENAWEEEMASIADWYRED